MRTSSSLAILFTLLGLSACGSAATATTEAETTTSEGDEAASEAAVSPAVLAAIDAPERTEDDRLLDAQRRPDLIFTFFGIQPGQRVADLFAGGGYTSELLASARSVERTFSAFFRGVVLRSTTS